MSSVGRASSIAHRWRTRRSACLRARCEWVVATTLLAATLTGAGLPRQAWATSQPSPGCHAREGPRVEQRGVERELVVDGQRRRYILDVPAAALTRRPAPLLLDFHGFQHSAAGVWRVSEFKRLGAEKGFVTVYPQGLPVNLLGRQGDGWEIFTVVGNRDLRLVEELIRDVSEEYCIDLRRVYATGFSNGGFLTHLLACHMADRIAGIAPVGAGMVDVPCKPAAPVAVIIHHGVRDERVGIERAKALGDRWRALNRCGPGEEKRADGCVVAQNCVAGGQVVFCEADLGHHWPAGAADRIWEFFEGHARRP